MSICKAKSNLIPAFVCVFISSFSAQTGGVKRKGPSKPGNAAKKKPRKKTDPLDEDTMVALALSSSLLEQEGELQTEPAAVSQVSLLPTLKWRTDAGTEASLHHPSSPKTTLMTNQ